MSESNEELMAEAMVVVQQIAPLLAGRSNNLVWCILSLLVARQLASFVGEPPEAVAALRNELLAKHLTAVRVLIPIEEEDILARVRSESH